MNSRHSMLQRPLRISISNASPEFSGLDSPLLRLTSAAMDCEVEVVPDAGEAQLRYVSNVQSDLQKLRAVAGRVVNRRLPRSANSLKRWSASSRGEPMSRHSSIWYTGENEAPPLGFGGTLSFEIDSYGGSNAYLPYWFFHVDGPFASRLSFSGLRSSTQELLNPRSVDTAGRPRFM